VKLWLVAIAAALSAAASGANGACMTDTQQSDFQAGLARNVDVNVTPGSVVLTNSSSAAPVDDCPSSTATV